MTVLQITNRKFRIIKPAKNPVKLYWTIRHIANFWLVGFGSPFSILSQYYAKSMGDYSHKFQNSVVL